MLCDVLTGCQTLDQAAVEFSPGGIVDIPDVCIWLVESGITDQALQAVTLTIAVFDIYQHSKTILKGDVLHPGILQLAQECIRHGCQSHFDEFIYSALCSHGSLPPVVIRTPCKCVAVFP